MFIMLNRLKGVASFHLMQNERSNFSGRWRGEGLHGACSPICCFAQFLILKVSHSLTEIPRHIILRRSGFGFQPFTCTRTNRGKLDATEYHSNEQLVHICQLPYGLNVSECLCTEQHMCLNSQRAVRRVFHSRVISDAQEVCIFSGSILKD